jgi:hypothetical protein
MTTRLAKWMAGGALGLALLAAGCGRAERDATEAAINAAQSAMDSVQAEAEKYVPEQLATARKTLQSARDELAKNDYGGALAAARDAANKVNDMAAAAVGKKAEWRKNWEDLNQSIPRAMDQVKGRMDAYSHGARMPEGVDKDMLEQVKAGYAVVKEEWEEAKAAAKHGDLGQAIEKATGTKEMLEKLREMLGIKT